MSKMAKNFLISISAVLIAVICLSLFLNANFIERYYLYREKQDMNRICDQLLESVEADANAFAEAEGGSGEIGEIVTRLEAENDVVIVRMEGSSDNDILNGRLRSAFINKGLGLEKFWLWEQDQEKVMEDGRRLAIYNQEKLHYSILVEYLSLGDEFLAVAKIIPSVTHTITLINQMTAAVFLAAVLLLIALIYFLVKRITTPLTAIGETARAIANQDFRRLELHTGDELELLAEDINEMSEKLQQTQAELKEKNRQMGALLDNVSHDLKTPLALIKAYTRGIQDGMDDGTFLDTIIGQNEKMEQMVHGLLNLSRMEKREYTPENVNLSGLIKQEADVWMPGGDAKQVNMIFTIVPGVMIHAGRSELSSIVTNLLSNAVKYVADSTVYVSLYKVEETEGYRMSVTNAVQAPERIDLTQIWKPFYVAEESRNKDLSGTGLGLPIVKAAAERCGFQCGCHIEGDRIVFTVDFHNTVT